VIFQPWNLKCDLLDSSLCFLTRNLCRYIKSADAKLPPITALSSVSSPGGAVQADEFS
jgi:hypothetical protein